MNFIFFTFFDFFFLIAMVYCKAQKQDSTHHPV